MIKFRDLYLVTRLFNLLTRSRTVAILGVLLLLGFSLWQSAHAIECVSPKIPGVKITTVYCSTNYCTTGQAACVTALNGDEGQTGSLPGSLSGCVNGGTKPPSTWQWMPAVANGPLAAESYLDINGSPSGTFHASLNAAEFCVDPPPPPTNPGNCDTLAGKLFQQKYSYSGGGTYGAASHCASNKCAASCGASSTAFSFGGGSQGMYELVQCTYTGASCASPNTYDGGGPNTPQPPVPETENGQDVEPGPPTQNGPTVNDEPITTDSNGDLEEYPGGPSGDNLQTPGGAIVTPEDSPSPPAPDNGIAGQPAVPDLTLTYVNNITNVTNNYNYYNSTTVNNSTAAGGVPSGASNGDGTGAANEGDGAGADGECDPEVEECGSGETGGGASDTCDVEPTCADEGTIECAILQQQWIDTCRTFNAEDVTSDEYAEAAGLPTGTDEEAVETLHEETDLGDELDLPNIPGMSGAACPQNPTFNAFGQSYSYDLVPLCDAMRYIGIFVVVFSTILAVRIATGSR